MRGIIGSSHHTMVYVGRHDGVVDQKYLGRPELRLHGFVKRWFSTSWIVYDGEPQQTITYLRDRVRTVPGVSCSRRDAP